MNRETCEAPPITVPMLESWLAEAERLPAAGVEPPEKVRDAMDRLKQVRENATRQDVCWISSVYDPTWTGSPRVATRDSDLELVAYHFIDATPPASAQRGGSEGADLQSVARDVVRSSLLPPAPPEQAEDVTEVESLKEENLTLLWNLAGCDMIATSGTPANEIDDKLARPALHAVNKMAAESAQLRERVTELEKERDEWKASAWQKAEQLDKLAAKDAELAEWRERWGKLRSEINNTKHSTDYASVWTAMKHLEASPAANEQKPERSVPLPPPVIWATNGEIIRELRDPGWFCRMDRYKSGGLWLCITGENSGTTCRANNLVNVRKDRSQEKALSAMYADLDAVANVLADLAGRQPQ